ncbi:Ig-like domain-containing protein [Gluconacetobacter tumulisoli]|uniref:Ig-like domain-containing protein n=1 Tax=Gluconacetobacter tumulisoli TaxID=1286189 RepID=A0A7W4PLK1_9PROT|nr:Ig-like domain-containing protein [Gluconacetobacter tumulisoli]MBB2202597.1 Ig-like domain-containing protein [Gluconacetobacter tumulisoli]
MKPILAALATAALLPGGCAPYPRTVIASSHAPANDAHYVRPFIVAANRATVINNWFVLNPDCSVADYVTVRLLTPPDHGTVTIRRGAFYPNYPVGEDRHACNMQPQGGITATYLPATDYVGADHFTLLIIAARGRSWTTDFQVSVR